MEPGARDLDYLKKTPVPGRPLLAPCSAEEVVTGGRPPTRSGLLVARRVKAFCYHLTPHEEVRRGGMEITRDSQRRGTVRIA